MTVPSWNAQEYHRQHSKAREPPRNRPNWWTVGLVAIFLGAAAVSATGAIGQDKVTVCHATGDPDQPFVSLSVAKAGFEHGHHRHHAGDYFLEEGQACDGSAAPEEPAADDVADATTSIEEVGDAIQSDASGEEGLDDLDDADGLNKDIDNNATDDGGDGGNATDTGGDDGNATQAGDDGGNATQPVDVRVRQLAWQDDFEVRLSMTVQNSDVAASDVSLRDELPDLRRTWKLSGEDAAACVLDDRNLSCWFGELAPGESRNIVLQAFTDRMPCGFPLTNTVHVDALDDLESRNDASSASIAARAC